MTRCEKYKDSGIEWIGTIPTDWEIMRSNVRTDLVKFLFYYFNSQVFKGQKGLCATCTINQLTSNMLNNLDIPIPPTKSKQTQIANYLDRKTTEIDQLISDKKALIQLYKEEKLPSSIKL